MSLDSGVAGSNWTDERWARAVLSFLCEPDSALAQRARLESASAVLPWNRVAELPERFRARDGIESALIALNQPAGVMIPGDSGWPTQLDHLAEPPLALWWRGHGTMREMCVRSVAVVGARQATHYGERTALRLAAELTEAGFIVVSGGAFGIDAAAHRGALTVGPSLCVLASGIDVPYPAAHESLLEHIARTGLIVSEAALGEPARRYRFLSRNRIIAALTRGTVVVEAALRSGSLSTARKALDIGRTVMGVPGPVTSYASLGVLELLRSDPRTHLVTCAADVLELCAHAGEHLVEQRDGPRDARDGVSGLARLALDHLADTPRSVDELSARLQRSQLDLLTALTELSLAGLAVYDGRWSATAAGRAPAPR